MQCLAQETVGLGRPHGLNRTSPPTALVAITNHGKPYLETDLDAVEYVDPESSCAEQEVTSEVSHTQAQLQNADMKYVNSDSSRSSPESHAHTQIIVKPKVKVKADDCKDGGSSNSPSKSVSFHSASSVTSIDRNDGTKNDKPVRTSVKQMSGVPNGGLKSEDSNNNNANVQTTTTTTTTKVTFRETEQIKGNNPDSAELTADDNLPSRHRPLKRIIARNLKDCKRSRSQDLLGGQSKKGGSLGIKRFRVHPARVSGMFGQKSQSEQHINWQCEGEEGRDQYKSRSKDCLVDTAEVQHHQAAQAETSVKIQRIPVSLTMGKDTSVSLQTDGHDDHGREEVRVSPQHEVQIHEELKHHESAEMEYNWDSVPNGEKGGLIDYSVDSSSVYKTVIDNSCDSILTPVFTVLETKDDSKSDKTVDSVEEDYTAKIVSPKHVDSTQIMQDETTASIDKLTLDTTTTTHSEMKETSVDHSIPPVHSSSSHNHPSQSQIADKKNSAKTTESSPLTISQLIRRSVPLKSAEINEHIYEDTLELLEEVDISDSFGSVEYTRPSSGSDDSTYPDSTSEGSFTLDDMTPEPTFFPQPRGGLPTLTEDLDESDEEEYEQSKPSMPRMMISSDCQESAKVKAKPSSPWTKDNARLVGNRHHQHYVPKNNMVSAATVSTVTPMPKHTAMSRYEEQQILQKIHQQVEEKIRKTEQEVDENQVQSETGVTLENGQRPNKSLPPNNFMNDGVEMQHGQLNMAPPESQKNMVLKNELKLKEVILDSTHLLVEVSEDSAFDETMISPVSSDKSPTEKNLNLTTKVGQPSPKSPGIHSTDTTVLKMNSQEQSCDFIKLNSTPPIKQSLLELKIHQIKQKYPDQSSQNQKLPADHTIAASEPPNFPVAKDIQREVTVQKEVIVPSVAVERDSELQYSELLREMSIEGDYQQVNQNTSRNSIKSDTDSSKTLSDRGSFGIETAVSPAKQEPLYSVVSKNKDSSPQVLQSSFLVSHQTSVYENRGINNKSFPSSHQQLSDSGEDSALNQDIDLDLEKLLAEFPSTETTTNNQHEQPKILGDFSLEDEVFGELSTEKKKQLQQQTKTGSSSDVGQPDFLTLLASCKTPLSSKSCSQIPGNEDDQALCPQKRGEGHLRVSLGNLASPKNDLLELTMELEEPSLSYSQLTIGRRKSRKSSSDSLNKSDGMYKTLQRMRSELGKPVENKEVVFTRKRDGSSELAQHTPRFVRDTSKVWYKPHISRDEAITLLRDKQAGMFVVRDSNSFPGAFGLAVKVAQVPPNVQTKGGDPQIELVRHFLIEPTSKGVKLKGCSNEPVFASLAALVYQHSITPLALPCKLLLPEHEPVDVPDSGSGPVSSAQLLAHGAACNVLFLYSADMESLTGPEAVAKATKAALTQDIQNKTTVVHFKVSSQGITLTDNKRRLFFRRHYPVASVTFCGMDPEDRKWTRNHDDTGLPMNAKIFGFVARKSGGSPDNQCHLFAELDTEQPAGAIVNFVTKVMIGQGRIMKT